MKKLLIIGGASSLLLILLGVWVYLLLFNQPSDTNDNQGIFANLNIFADQDTTPIDTSTTNTAEETPVVNVNESRLRQLTTRPVIGFSEVYSTSTEPYYATYIEAGTGHIYQINMNTGEEVRVSNTTIPNASEAVISNDGQTVAIRSGQTKSNNVVYGTLNDDGGLDNRALTNTIYDMAFANNGDLLFTEPTTTGLRARRLAADDQSLSTLFEVPFRAAEVIWSTDGIAPHYVYTKPTAELTGYVYQIENGELRRLPMSGRGIAAIANNEHVAYYQLTNAGYEGFTFIPSVNESFTVPIIPIPEKCAFTDSESDILYCGFAITNYTDSFPDSWHKGVTNFADRIWEINLDGSLATQLINPLQAAGREIDITHMTTSTNTAMLYFINKNDHTLWSYER